jgi:acyl dehydratase
MSNRYDRFKTLNEMALNEEFHTPARTVTEADCVVFTSLAGLKAPLFIDAEYSRKHGKYGRRVGPGLLTASFTAGMMEDILGPFTLAALELGSLTFTKPLFHGDTIHCVITVANKSDTRKPNVGILTIKAEQFNQNDEKVFELTGKFLMLKERVGEDGVPIV